MQSPREWLDWRMLCWWLAVLTVALLIKRHYSIASAADLDWMLRPLALLLEWASGHAFQQDALHEWVSPGADVRLVKACAGINFLLMSLLAWAWVFRPSPRANGNPAVWIAGYSALLCTVAASAWITSLLANSLRILVAMHLPEQDSGMHRIIGLLVYVPLLSLQLLAGDRKNWKRALAGPVLLYFLLMALVPLLTGNALRSPVLFIEHLFTLAAMAALMLGLYLTWEKAVKGSHHSN